MRSMSTFSETAPSVCLFTGNPNGLVSLWDLVMKDFNAHDFLLTSGQIGQVHMEIRCGRIPRDTTWQSVSGSLQLLEKDCIALELDSTLAQIQRVRETIKRANAGFNLESFGREVMEVHIRMVDELKSRNLYAIEREKAEYLKSNQFPSVVAERFSDAVFDMNEAAKCYAFDRSTACVFHLMRVTEHGLHAIAKALEIKDERPNWDPIIKKIDAELKAEYKDRKYKGSADFLAHMSTHTHAVKVAWRNRVMHVEKKHTPEEARDIFNATVGFMRYLAEELPKKRPGIVQSIRDMIK